MFSDPNLTVKLSFLALILCLSVRVSSARPAEIILLRHAEKPPEDSNTRLSTQGKERAHALVQFLTTTPALAQHGMPVALFATQTTPRGHSYRTRETLEPLAQNLKLPIRTPYPAKDVAALAKRILREPAYDGKTVVICWVHDYLPELAEALGVKPKPAAWKHKVFDRVWVITYPDKEASLKNLPQKLLPGDARN